MNSWSVYELQRQIEYKVRWLGLPVNYIKPGGTSSVCGMWVKASTEEHRMMSCSTCKGVVDRDVNAARNILLRGTQAVQDGTVGEAVMAEPGKSQPVICRVDAVKSCDGIYLPAT